MTAKEEYENILALLNDNPKHTIVRHVNSSGRPCWRIRDKAVNPLANISEHLFTKLVENNLLNKLNDREWQLKHNQSN